MQNVDSIPRNKLLRPSSPTVTGLFWGMLKVISRSVDTCFSLSTHISILRHESAYCWFATDIHAYDSDWFAIERLKLWKYFCFVASSSFMEITILDWIMDVSLWETPFASARSLKKYAEAFSFSTSFWCSRISTTKTAPDSSAQSW